MPFPPEPLREHPSTYFVQDRSNEQELLRLITQDHLLTAGMGGVLPKQTEPERLQRVLDVACGPGGWLVETAQTYPQIKRLVGVDVSSKMVDYAREQAAAQGVSDRVEFHAMDALRMLEFPTDTFDLVNQRLGSSFLRKWDWPKLLREFQRVTRPGGIVRLVESRANESNSQALMQLIHLLLQALWHAGHLFAPERQGVGDDSADLLRRFGLRNVQTREYTLQFYADTPEGKLFAEDSARMFRTLVPFIRKWSLLPENYEELYQQALREMQRPDFVITWRLVTAWGTTPLS